MLLLLLLVLLMLALVLLLLLMRQLLAVQCPICGPVQLSKLTRGAQTSTNGHVAAWRSQLLQPRVGQTLLHMLPMVLMLMLLRMLLLMLSVCLLPMLQLMRQLDVKLLPHGRLQLSEAIGGD